MGERFRPHLTVAIIIEREGRYLMVEELNEDQDNRHVFGMPAGHVEAREGIVEAARREAREETGCEVELTAITGIYDYVKESETIIRICFAAALVDPTACPIPDDPDHEILGARWMGREEIYARRGEWRTRLVGMCMDDYLKGSRHPLSLITKLVP
ncbi:MAG: NUDIX domain-containing protein [Succinivibrionaceae bacterium]|nr:NUDIX domain-containing protein [Succinivibrionaceae bacterium]